MSRSDQWVNISLGLIILLYVSVLAIGYYINKLLCLVSLMNLFAGISLILYWAIRQIQIQQHTIEFREILVLGFETLVIACAIYTLMTSMQGSWLRITQYIVFGIHLLLMVLGLIFMLTFKMTRLI